MIFIEKYSTLSIALRSKLNKLIDSEFGHIPIVKETEWAAPDWSIIKYEADQIVSFYNIVLREIKVDGRSYLAGGINNVITPKEWRGNGHSTSLLRGAEELLFERFSCEMGVLFCADELILFYQRLNWYKVNSVVSIDQPEGKKVWNSNTMLLTRDRKIEPKEIDVNGLPW